MPRTLDEYHAFWRSVADGPTMPPDNERVLPTTAVMIVSPRSNMAGTGYIFVDDFGDLIADCRYVFTRMEFEEPPPLPDADDQGPDIGELLPGLKMMQELWEQARPKVSADEIARRRASAEAAFDALLADYVREGYRPEMGKRLLEIANSHFLDYEMLDVFVLPEDLQRLLDDVGNPLVDWDAEDEEAATAAAPAFDLNNPQHRERLAEHLNEAG